MRKVFITGAPAFSKPVDVVKYPPIGECKLPECYEVGYPITMVMEGVIENKENEDYAVIVVGTGSDKTSRHMDMLEKEIKSHGFNCPVERVQGDSGRSAEDPKGLVLKMLEKFQEDDDVYVSIEFGAKPIVAAILYGIEIADLALEDVEIRGIFYGEKDWDHEGDYYMQDVSALYHFSQIAGEIGIIDKADLIKTVSTMFSLIGE